MARSRGEGTGASRERERNPPLRTHAQQEPHCAWSFTSVVSSPVQSFACAYSVTLNTRSCADISASVSAGGKYVRNCALNSACVISEKRVSPCSARGSRALRESMVLRFSTNAWKAFASTPGVSYAWQAWI